jgi:lipopolysaccharide assembly protein B
VSARLALVLALLFAVLVAYLTSLNTGRVRVALGADWAYEVPLMALVVGAFLAGVGLAWLLGLLRDLGRSYQQHRLVRQARREESLKATYHRGVDAQLAGKSALAAEAYEEVLRREPGYAAAHARLAELARERGDAPRAIDHQLQAIRADERPETLLALAESYRAAGRLDEAASHYARVLEGDRDHLTALRGLRDTAAERGRWTEALDTQERVVRLTRGSERAAAEADRLTGIRYELARALLAEGNAHGAIARLRDLVRAHPEFVPGALLLGDAYRDIGEATLALRTWERALEARAALPLLARIERFYREEGRPSRMIAAYQQAVARAPDSLAFAFALGRVYFELAMLDEAADQFQKLEVRDPDLAPIHACLGAIFERRGQGREALEEYRRALRLAGAFEWPHRCAACGAGHAGWVDRCPSCRSWNTSRP